MLGPRPPINRSPEGKRDEDRGCYSEWWSTYSTMCPTKLMYFLLSFLISELIVLHVSIQSLNLNRTI